MNYQRWEAAGVRRDDRNIPFHLKKCLTAMRSDVPQPAPHHDFLHCLNRNRIHRKWKQGEMQNIFISYLSHIKNNNNTKTRCFAVNVQHDADEVFLSILNSVLLQIDDRDLVGFWSHLFCTAQIPFPLFVRMSISIFFLLRHLKSRTYTRFPRKHSCSVWSAASSRLSPAICSTCHCTSEKFTILWCFFTIYSFVHLCGLCFFPIDWLTSLVRREHW